MKQWNDADDAKLRKLFPEPKNWKKVMKKASSTGIRTTNWTPEEDAVLRKLWSK